MQNDAEKHSELRSELLKEKEKMPILIPEAPIVNPNAALGTPPRLNSDGEADPEVEEVMDQSGTDEGNTSLSFSNLIPILALNNSDNVNCRE